MNDQQRAAMTMALEALDCRYNDNRVNAAITALREALAQPTPQEITVFEGYISSAQTEALREALAQPQAVPMELAGVKETIAEGGGFWHSCSGCHELNEGHPTGAFSSVFNCNLGNGCDECGGIGAIWDNADYEEMAAGWTEDNSAQPLGEWVDLTDYEIGVAFTGSPCLIPHQNQINGLRAVIAKFKEKNTPPVVPQGEDDMMIAYMVGYEKGKDETKAKVLACYSPDDTANDWAEKIKELK